MSGERIPAHLSSASRAWYRRIVAEYRLEQPDRRLLQAAAEAWDRMVQARDALATHGLTYPDRYGNPRARPEVAIERDSRLAFARLIRDLALTGEEPDAG